MWNMHNDCFYNSVCLNTDKGVNQMSTLSLNMNINDCPVTLEFRMIQDEPDWETFKVMALLPSAITPSGSVEGKQWVIVNGLLSDDDWVAIEYEIGWNYDKLVRQAMEQEY